MHRADPVLEPHVTAARQPADPTAVRTFVLDTSVLLSDPGALARFAEHTVVLPLVVISELEGKRHHPELGWFARQTLRSLDELRIKHGRLDAPVPIGTKRGSPSGTFTRAKRSSPDAGSRANTARLTDNAEMYGNGCPGPTASGVSTG